MIIRFTYLASAFSIAAASKSAKTPATPAPTDADKAGKSNTPTASKSSKGKTGDDYFIAPFSCPQRCISADGYEPDSHLLEDAVVECDVNDSYQKWKVHQVGSLLKFESAAQHDHDMCLAVVHQDPDHLSNDLEALNEAWLGWNQLTGVQMGPSVFFNFDGQLVEAGEDGSRRRNLLSEDEVDGICSGKLGMAHCNHPGSYWYNTGGNLLSAFCWDQDTPTAMSVDETCNGMKVSNTTMTGDLTTSETFMILGSN